MLIYKDVTSKTLFSISQEEAGVIINALSDYKDNDCFDCYRFYDDEDPVCLQCLEKTQRNYHVARDIIDVLNREVFS